MRKTLINFLSIAFALATFNVAAEERLVSASNGVEVSINEDDFAERYEFSAPTLKFEWDNGDSVVLLVAAVKEPNNAVAPHITGFIFYRDDWRKYSRAIFKGGDEATFKSVSRDVVSCSSSPCTLSETFNIYVTTEDIEKHSSDDELLIQIRADSTDKFIVKIPVKYIAAVQELYAAK